MLAIRRLTTVSCSAVRCWNKEAEAHFLAQSRKTLSYNSSILTGLMVLIYSILEIYFPINKCIIFSFSI